MSQTTMHNVTEKIQAIVDAVNRHGQIIIPDSLKESFDATYDYLQNYRTPSPRQDYPINLLPSTLGSLGSDSAALSPGGLVAAHDPDVQFNVKLNRQTTLEALYIYKPGTLVEYPTTSATGWIGHLFLMDSKSLWTNPARNFAYSQGAPDGSSGSRQIKCRILVDENGKEVPCREIHSTCQGSKICPFGDLNTLINPHIEASREALERRLTQDQVIRNSFSPHRLLFERTLSFFFAIKKAGCLSPPNNLSSPSRSTEELDESDTIYSQVARGQRGHPGKSRCNGEILMEYTGDGLPYLRCEHYIRNCNVDHFIDLNIAGTYNVQYLEALFRNDIDMISELEENAAEIYHIGPQAKCPYITNFSTVKANCPFEHRKDNGEILIPSLNHLACHSKFRILEPLEEFRSKCSKVLILCRGDHPHPIPLPMKTPPAIMQGIRSLLDSLQAEIPDLTPRRLLRHAATEAFLRKNLPKVANPTFIDLHPSLGNKEHLRSIILKAKESHFPSGTGWEGLIHLKNAQDATLLPEDAYIRVAIEIPFSQMQTMTTDSEDLQDAADIQDVDSETPFRMVICMRADASSLLLSARYLQCDIGFKRIVGFKEFELGGLDPETRTSITYCRIYLNRQNAIAHQIIFQKIDDIVRNDTGEALRWRHLHATHVSEMIGILQIGVDQHGGQAKGLGKYLVSKAQEIPQKPDLHEPHRFIQDLDEYDHLKRVLRLCTNHFFRNIQKASVPESIKNDMRSLVCMEHKDWNATLARIESLGGKAGRDWLNDKIRSKFALPGICWEKSYIPRVIWMAGDSTTNLIESVHFDVNLEGTACTLVGGVKKGQYYDGLKFKTRYNLKSMGIRPSYKSGHISESVTRGLKRKSHARHRRFAAEDAEIERSNKRLKDAHSAKIRTESRLQIEGRISPQHAANAVERASKRFDKAVEASLQAIGSGSGKVGLLLPKSMGAYRSRKPNSM